jgi:hypothetical protein
MVLLITNFIVAVLSFLFLDARAVRLPNTKGGTIKERENVITDLNPQISFGGKSVGQTVVMHNIDGLLVHFSSNLNAVESLELCGTSHKALIIGDYAPLKVSRYNGSNVDFLSVYVSTSRLPAWFASCDSANI